ncbi:phosphoribosyl transferase domain-containing protein [Pochonia chlamydosporia 170]|uniref:Phosphoribosyl transferase domain-containing protein n=1 Tax=Pochonia chlamydosporia 170 TaxID=1380566 RepID=A0A179FPZ9_METCM|nr:phosphoribosyl transferase domain-containing protein [Pochonia chlamydosporia 170]OAQ67664.2 phosphoribosyl transferase domain-containing protein [Pochonia chlamydosporia 170]
MVNHIESASPLAELTNQVPVAPESNVVKSPVARAHRPAAIVKPRSISQVQTCVRWALKHNVGLTILGGGHSGHCLQPNVVAIDMSAFNQVYIVTDEESKRASGNDMGLIVAGGGCKAGDIIRQSLQAGMTVPLGSRPSVGAGLWLQGGIGHLARLHGLSCDAIVGAVMVSVRSGEVFLVGHVPSQHRPRLGVRPENDGDLLWALKGAGTDFGFVVSVTFKAYAAPSYSVRNWVIPFADDAQASLKLRAFDELVTTQLPQSCSAEAHMYFEDDQLRFGVHICESSTTETTPSHVTGMSAVTELEPDEDVKGLDGVEVFEHEMCVVRLRGGYGSKTSSFKRCIFLKYVGSPHISTHLITALKTRPTPMCYLQLRHVGGAVKAVSAGATAFGCRDWNFAFVISGVWPRHQDNTETARSAVRWVYDVTEKLLPFCSGVYGADLGPDPRDTALAAKAFGPNGPRLARLKRSWDPHNVLAFACPLPPVSAPKLIILVTGESCAGKDYCADVWVSVFNSLATGRLAARSIGIGDGTKRAYAAPNQVQQRPQLPEENFLKAVDCGPDVDVLLITGVRDEWATATFAHLVPESRLLEIRVQASTQTRSLRRGCQGSDDVVDDTPSESDYTSCPTLIFNDSADSEAVEGFAKTHLTQYFHHDLHRLAAMVTPIANFPSPGITFQHVFDISQQPGGLALCTSLLQSHFVGDWRKIDNVI